MSALEKHHPVQYYAQLWGIGVKKLRELFREEPGVPAVGEDSRLVGRKYVRRHFTLLIPESVAKRVYDKLLGKAKRSA